jgi:hypothetical protein
LTRAVLTRALWASVRHDVQFRFPAELCKKRFSPGPPSKKLYFGDKDKKRLFNCQRALPAPRTLFQKTFIG